MTVEVLLIASLLAVGDGGQSHAAPAHPAPGQSAPAKPAAPAHAPAAKKPAAAEAHGPAPAAKAAAGAAPAETEQAAVAKVAEALKVATTPAAPGASAGSLARPTIPRITSRPRYVPRPPARPAPPKYQLRWPSFEERWHIAWPETRERPALVWPVEQYRTPEDARPKAKGRRPKAEQSKSLESEVLPFFIVPSSFQASRAPGVSFSDRRQSALAGGRERGAPAAAQAPIGVTDLSVTGFWAPRTDGAVRGQDPPCTRGLTRPSSCPSQFD